MSGWNTTNSPAIYVAAAIDGLEDELLSLTQFNQLMENSSLVQGNAFGAKIKNCIWHSAFCSDRDWPSYGALYQFSYIAFVCYIVPVIPIMW
jgi:hypothetical protein